MALTPREIEDRFEEAAFTLRRQYYWARVRAGKMRQADADKRIALMAAIVKRLTVTAAL